MNENADNNRSGLKIFLVALLLILTVSIPTTIYFYINPPELTFIKRLFNPPQNTYTLNPSEREQFPALAKDSDELNVVRQDTSLSNVQKYLRGIEERSETANTEREQETLALRTAIFLSLNRDKNTTQNFQKATDIFVDLINTNQGTDATTTYYRNFAKIGLAWLNVQCCDSETVNPYLFTKKIDGYTFTYNTYRARFKNNGLAKYLSLIDFMETVDPYYKTDATYKRTMIDIETRILAAYGKILDKQTSDYVLTKLGSEVENYSKNNKLTYDDVITTQVGAKSLYVYGYDILKQKTNSLSETENLVIDKNYQEVNDLLLNPPLDADPMGLKDVLYFNNMRFLLSMKQRYGDSTDQELQSNLVEFQLNLINSSKEMGNIAYNYFHSQEFKTGQLPGHTNFASLRTKYKQVDEYLRSIGI